MKIENGVLVSIEKDKDIKNGKFVVPDGVKSIGVSAFQDCSDLTSVTISNGVTSIGAGAFSNCVSLINVTIPDGVKSIGKYAFYSCWSLTSIKIPDSVTTIGDFAFTYCTGLTTIKMSNSVTTIGEWAFSDCSNLATITIPYSVTSIGACAFSSCYKLIEVINLSKLNITKGNTANGYVGNCALNVKVSGSSDIVNKDGYLFYTCDNTNYLLGYNGDAAQLTLPDNYNGQNYEIYKYAFKNCSSLTSIEIPDSVTSICDDAFFGCSSLATITIPDSVTNIGRNAFAYCTGLTSITIPNSVTWISGSAFCECSGLTSITIPDGVTTIGDYAFYGCSGLTSITIPNSVTWIGEYAFHDCSKLTNIEIPKAVTSIGVCAFGYCGKLQKNDSKYYFKGFRSDLTCRDFQYKENQWYEIDDSKIELCKCGFHACKNAFELFNYYNGKINEDIVIYKVELAGEIKNSNTSDTSKVVASKIRLVEKINSYKELLN